MLTEQELRRIGEACLQHGVLILSDDVYERIYYTPEFPRMATLGTDIARITLTVGSVGRSFNATGWRLGYVIGHPERIPYVQMSHILRNYTTAGPVQEAAAQAYRIAASNGFWQENIKSMKGKIDSFCEVLDEVGLPVISPSSHSWRGLITLLVCPL